MITETEFRERYDAFKDGFIAGASGKGLMGSKHCDEYTAGFEKGRAMFIGALNTKIDQLKSGGVSKDITVSEFTKIYAPQAKEWQDIADSMVHPMVEVPPSPYDVTTEQRRRAELVGRLLINPSDFNILPDPERA